MKRLLSYILLLVMVNLACARSNSGASGSPTSASAPAVPATPPSVPAEYQSLADELNSEMGAFENTLSQQSDQSPSNVIIATDLAYANGNIGEALLQSQTMQLNQTLLDRLQTIGVKGVVIQISFPLLDPSFPRNSEYLQFFQNVVAEAHKRGIKVLVESGTIFSGTAYSSVKVDYSKYTTQTFLHGRENQVLLIASQVRPDYLMIGNEPTTEEMLTHLTITPPNWGNFLNDTMSRIDHSNILIGTGTGTWEDPSYFNQAMQVKGIDFIDLHIYPMGKNASLLDRAFTYAQKARDAGKRVTISEAWLYKASPELNGGYGNFSEIYDRDVYSFWEPLDARFITDILKLADTTHMDFVSFFWTRYFFSYLDYNATDHNQSTESFNRQINQAGLAAVQNGSISSLGQWFQQELSSRH
jgi:hypothetical protein